jgi:hypothetical protein
VDESKESIFSTCRFSGLADTGQLELQENTVGRKGRPCWGDPAVVLSSTQWAQNIIDNVTACSIEQKLLSLAVTGLNNLSGTATAKNMTELH